MKGKEIVYRTLEFREPERLAIVVGPDSDITHIGYSSVKKQLDEWTYLDEWKCEWKSFNRKKGDQGQVIKHPLFDWGNFKKYAFPDSYSIGRFDSTIQQLNNINRNDCFIVGSLGKGPMHLLEDLRGFDNYLTDIILNPDRIKVMLDGIFGFLTGLVMQYGELRIDAVLLTDDQAIQTGPVFSMELWRTYLKPYYKKFFDLVHNYGMKAYMHTCGNLDQHLVELKNFGVDIIDNKQPELWMNSPQAGQVKGKISFSSCIDIQTRIFNLDIDNIGDEVTRLIRALSVKEGGFMGTCYTANDLDIPVDKNNKMIEAFKNLNGK